MSHCQKVLDALRDGQWHTTASLYRDCGPMILHSRISDLRNKGHHIEGRHVPGKTGADGYEYRRRVVQPAAWTRPPNETAQTTQLVLTVIPEHYDI